jgi:YVTN family beta-propeller protein
MFGKRRAESGDNADGKFSGSQVCKKGGFHMRSLRALRIVGIGLAFAAILASGGLPGGSQSGQEGQSALMLTLSYPDNKVAFIDLRFAPDGKVIDRKVTTVDVPQGPSGLDISPDGKLTYVVSFDANALSVLDNTTRQLIKTVNLGASVNPYAVAFHPEGNFAYTVNAGTRNITVIDAVNHAVLTTIALPGASSPRGLAFSPNGLHAYASDTETDTVWVLDAVNHKLQETLRTGGQCSAYVKASNNEQWVYVADRCLSRVYALEIAKKTFTPIQLSGNSGAWFITFDPTDRVAFASQIDPRRNIYSGKISIIDVAQKKEIGTIDVSQGAATAALEGLQTRYAPAGLEVLPLPGELLSLIVFPWLAGTPILGVPFTPREERGVISVEIGAFIPIPTVLTRTPTGTVFQTCCKHAGFQVRKDQIKTKVSRKPKELFFTITIPGWYHFACNYVPGEPKNCNATIEMELTGEWKKYRLGKEGKIEYEENVKPAGVFTGVKGEGIAPARARFSSKIKCEHRCTSFSGFATATWTLEIYFTMVEDEKEKREHVKGTATIKFNVSGCENRYPDPTTLELDSAKIEKEK